MNLKDNKPFHLSDLSEISMSDLSEEKITAYFNPVVSTLQSQTRCDQPQTKFSLPIDEQEVRSISPTMQADLELSRMTETLFPIWGKSKGAQMTVGKYTTNSNWLHTLQDHYRCRNELSKEQNLDNTTTPKECADYRETVLRFYKNASFMSQYNYMNWKIAEPFNHSAEFMSVNTASQYMTPIMHSFFPLYVLLMPIISYLFDKLCGSTPCNGDNSETCPAGFWSMYTCSVFQSLKRHTIGKQIFKIADSPVILALLLGAWGVYYAMQGYFHYRHMWAFTSHLKSANEFVQSTRDMLRKAVNNWTYRWEFSPFAFNNITPRFYKQMRENVGQWITIADMLDKIPDLNKAGLRDCVKVGPSLVTLYKLYTNEDIMQSLMAVPTWLEYAGFVEECANHSYLHNAEFIDKTSQESHNRVPDNPKMYTIYEEGEDTEQTVNTEQPEEIQIMINHIHPAMITPAVVPNTADLSKHALMTGPNASGKTTCMKSILVNLLLSQNIGKGRFDFARFVPYTHFHLYMNNPDVLERDSLFQAEARRCKLILDEIESDTDGGPVSHHFCAFDELFTGTNPQDATRITFLYLQHIATRCTNVQFWLTTHFHSVCNQFEQLALPNVQCVCMSNEINNGANSGVNTGVPGSKDNFTYKMQTGISSEQNATHILRQLDFPNDIIESSPSPE